MRRFQTSLLFGFIGTFTCAAPGICQDKSATYPEGVVTHHYESSGDRSQQPTLFWAPPSEKGPRPLLVALHTWSNDYRQAGGETVYARWCQQEDWAFLHPNFRGANRSPEAMGSDLVVADILSAIEFAKQQTLIDENRIYCIGVSGGGHASLLMAGRAPEIWAGISAWCGISDIAKWHQECRASESFTRYADHIEKSLGGSPSNSPEIAEAARLRSPVTYLSKAQEVALDIYHGNRDGRAGSVPFTHSLDAWNAVVPPEYKISAQNIANFYKTQFSLVSSYETDKQFPTFRIPFRRQHHQTRLTIFEGGHEINHLVALNWLAAQRRNQPAVWDLEKVTPLTTIKTDANSGL